MNLVAILRTLRREAMAGGIIYCKRCGDGYGSVGERPKMCPSCLQKADWTETPPTSPTPKRPFKLNVNDRRFLRSIRISADD